MNTREEILAEIERRKLDRSRLLEEVGFKERTGPLVETPLQKAVRLREERRESMVADYRGRPECLEPTHV